MCDQKLTQVNFIYRMEPKTEKVKNRKKLNKLFSAFQAIMNIQSIHDFLQLSWVYQTNMGQYSVLPSHLLMTDHDAR